MFLAKLKRNNQKLKLKKNSNLVDGNKGANVRDSRFEAQVQTKRFRPLLSFGQYGESFLECFTGPGVWQ